MAKRLPELQNQEMRADNWGCGVLTIDNVAVARAFLLMRQWFFLVNHSFVWNGE